MNKKITKEGCCGIGMKSPTHKLHLKPYDVQTSSIIFFGKYPNEKEEVMRISKDGFFWHGEKVEDKEHIYERFNQWLKEM